VKEHSMNKSFNETKFNSPSICPYKIIAGSGDWLIEIKQTITYVEQLVEEK
jgi:hypothetical protein